MTSNTKNGEGAAAAAPKHRRGDPYDVGFARPPKATQFKKGKSGNPRGRPPKKPDLYGAFHAALAEKVTVSVGGRPQTVTIQIAILMKLQDMAVSGDVAAGKLVTEIVESMPKIVGLTFEQQQEAKRWMFTLLDALKARREARENGQ